MTVDTAALGLVQSGNSYISPPPPSDPICGTTITSDLVLMADLDCSETTTTAITLGADGAVIAERGAAAATRVPAYAVQAVDTTGAGDAFVGAVAAELAAGRSLVDAVRFATAVSAVSVQRVGAQVSYADRREVEAFIAAAG